MQPQNIFTNGRISVGSDLIFGLVILTEDGWYPFSQCSEDDKDIVCKLVDYNPTCPYNKEIYSSNLRKVL
jgi:hypothetical protein